MKMGFNIKLEMVSMGVDSLLIWCSDLILDAFWLSLWLDGAQPRPCGLGVVIFGSIGSLT